MIDFLFAMFAWSVLSSCPPFATEHWTTVSAAVQTTLQLLALAAFSDYFKKLSVKVHFFGN